MKQYIDKSALVAEIEKWVSGWTERLNNTNPSNPSFFEGGIEVGKHILSFLDTLEVIEMNEPNIPKHSYFETIYHCGSEPRWKVGDILAVYEFYRDYEGEEVFGKVIDVYKDEEDDDWVYVFEGEGGGALCERELVSDEAYRKN